MTPKLISHLKSLFRRGRSEDDLSEELQFHLQNEIEKKINADMSCEEVRYAALALGIADNTPRHLRTSKTSSRGSVGCPWPKGFMRLLGLSHPTNPLISSLKCVRLEV